MSSSRHARGATLIEVIMFMVIVGIAVSAVLSVFIGTTRRSGEPMIEKQALAIAESLLEEVRLMPFTFCDPDDTNVGTATGAFVGPLGCAVTVEAMGPEGSEARSPAATPYDNVNDYAGFNMAGIVDVTTGLPIAGLGGYTATVAIAPFAFGPAPNTVPATESLLITVTVTGPAGIGMQIEGVRTRYAPNL